MENSYSIQSALKTAYENWGDRNYIYTRTKQGFIPKTFAEAVTDTWYLAEALTEAGFKDKLILLYAENSYEWCIADFAVTGIVGVTVAANADWKENDLRNVIKISDVSCVIYSNTKTDVINALKKEFNIEYISIQDDLPALIKRGKEISDRKSGKCESFKRRSGEMRKIFFTSGTTSKSKAVMLSEKNMFSGFDGLHRRTGFDENDSAYLFLPLSHTYGGIYNLLASLHFGSALYLCSDPGKIFEELAMTDPTVFCAVPLIYERAYAMLGENIKYAFGKNIKYLFSAGAKSSPDIRKIYKSLGLPLIEAYALSETSSSLSMEFPGNTGISSVGTVFEEISIKFINTDENGDGEILVKGDNIALGYYNNREKTAEAFGGDGYFHTGDIGHIGKDGELYLTGRKKRLIKLSNARSVYPEELEILLLENGSIKTAFVYEHEGKIMADITLNSLYADVNSIIAGINEVLPGYKQIRAVNVL